jgi:hypothetical protein
MLSILSLNNNSFHSLYFDGHRVGGWVRFLAEPGMTYWERILAIFHTEVVDELEVVDDIGAGEDSGAFSVPDDEDLVDILLGQ